jgi:integrase
MIMRDYVEILVDTGARPGNELMNLKWKQIKYSMDPKMILTGVIDDTGASEGEDPEELMDLDLRQIVEMTVTGKTGTRKIIGRQPTVRALARIARRNFDVDTPLSSPLINVARSNNDDYVLRTRDKKLDVSASFQKMLEQYLREHNLLFDPETETNRVFYSFRHTYATLALTHDKVPIHTLAKQMGTSVLMIERHYSHLKVIEALEQLRGDESRRQIASSSTVEEIYKSNAFKRS